MREKISAFAIHPVYSVHLADENNTRIWCYWRFDKAMDKFREGVSQGDLTQAFVYRHDGVSGEATGLVAQFTKQREIIIYGVKEEKTFGQPLAERKGSRGGTTGPHTSSGNRA